ncbi:MAG: PAS domain-containing protein [Rhodothermaceae bacterium]|nr:PAS domain-containing protein [Rhodothermaceae bacterium]
MDHRMIGEIWMDVFGCDDKSLYFNAIRNLQKGYQTTEFTYTGKSDYGECRYQVKCSRIPGNGSKTSSCLLVLNEESARSEDFKTTGNHFDMHKMVTRIAMDFASVPTSDMGRRTHEALADIGQFTGADRVNVFRYDFNNRLFTNTHEWCADGISLEIQNLQNQPLNYLGDLVNSHIAGENVYIHSVEDLPDTDKTLKKLLEDQGIKSSITIPMIFDSECLGFVGLDSVIGYRKWDVDEIQILRLFADLLANTENRKQRELLLRKSETRNKALLDALPDLIFRLSRDGTFLDAHASEPGDLLIPPEEIPGKHIRDILPDEAATLCLDHIEEVFRSGNRVIFEYELVIDRSTRNYEARVVKSDNDEVLFVVRDITQQVVNNQRLQHVTKNIPGAIYTFILTPDGTFHIPYISDSIEELSGVKAELIKSDFRQVLSRIHTDDIPALFTSIRGSAQNMCRWHGEFRIKNREENWIWIQADSTPQHGNDSNIVWYGHIRDITEQKNAQEALRQREAYLSALIENQNGYIWLKDLEGKFILVNNKFARACNFDSVHQMIGKTELDINPEKRSRKYIREDQNVIRKGKTRVNQEKMNVGSGEVWFETYKSPVKDQNGKIIGTTGYSLDITDRKKKVEQVRRLNRKLNDINMQKDKLFSILAHDLRNPFAGSIGMLEMILNEGNNFSESELKEYIGLLYDNTISTYSMVENLLEWSRTQRDQINHSPDNVDLRMLLEQTYQVVAGPAYNKKIELRNDVPDGTTVYADREMLHSILRNLITNGIKFTRPGGHITVGVKCQEGSVDIEVKDSGVGMREEERLKLFRIDYKPSSSGTNGEKGSGLGLQICKEFTEKHGGKIAVDSKPGKGSTFTVNLPDRPKSKK